MEKALLASKIYQAAHITGSFKLRSGITSNQYFDKYRFESDPALLKAIAEKMVPLIPEGTEVLAALEMGGIPIATLLSQITGIPVCFVRKKAKDYGTCKFAEGIDIERKQLLIVEDVITSGGQAILSATDLRMAHAKVENVICVIDREQGGPEKMATAGLKLKALFTRSELEASVA
jgi:orotate phosphoribosyltransferase